MDQANTNLIVANPHNACIITFFMNNIDIKVVQKQREVVAKFNKSGIEHYSVQTGFEHGLSMDLAWQLNGVEMATIGANNAPKRFDFDVLVFLDVDALPLNFDALDYIVERAAVGQVLCGDVQNTNHLENGKHLFVAPSVLAVSEDTFVAMGKPSGRPTLRSDVAEEYTWFAEKNKVPVEYFLPLSFEAAPAEKAYWDLQNESIPEQYRKYGRGTTFGLTPDGDHQPDTKPMFWHNFQSFHPGQQDRFMKKAEALLNG